MEDEDQNFEVIPTSPIRKLEKRMGRLESSSQASEVQRLIEQIIELIKSNQRIIDDVIKSDSELRNEISRLPGKIDAMIGKMDEFLELLKEGAVDESATASEDVMKPFVEKIGELVEQNKKSVETNQAVLANLSSIDNRLKRLYVGGSTAQARY
jgi:soluble cytochrome b562